MYGLRAVAGRARIQVDAPAHCQPSASTAITALASAFYVGRDSRSEFCERHSQIPVSPLHRASVAPTNRLRKNLRVTTAMWSSPLSGFALCSHAPGCCKRMTSNPSTPAAVIFRTEPRPPSPEGAISANLRIKDFGANRTSEVIGGGAARAVRRKSPPNAASNCAGRERD
jgi:hypothetical protein